MSLRTPDGASVPPPQPSRGRGDARRDSPGLECHDVLHEPVMANDRRGADERSKRSHRKEKVIHTRVPEVLAEELKRLAETMRVPVSNVVRTFLEDAIDAVSSASSKAEGELLGLANRLREPHERPADPPPSAPAPGAAPPLAGVIGFQPLTLAQDTVCALSGRALKAGERAFLGIRTDDGPPLIVAPESLPRLFDPEESS